MSEPTIAAPFRTTRRVEFSDTDAAGIAHFTAFFRYMEQAEHELLRSVGLSVLMSGPEGEFGWPRVSAKCDFSSTAKFEELLEIEVHISRLGKKSVTYRCRFLSRGQELATGEITSVCCRVNTEGELVSIPIPTPFREKLQPFVLTPDS